VRTKLPFAYRYGDWSPKIIGVGWSKDQPRIFPIEVVMRYTLFSFFLAFSLLLTGCGKSVVAFSIFQLSDDITLSDSNANMTAKVSIISEESGGFSKKGARIMEVIIQGSRSEVLGSLNVSFGTPVSLDIDGHWEMDEGPIFVLEVQGVTEEIEFSNTYRLEI
jgi:hypothetical protein